MVARSWSTLIVAALLACRAPSPSEPTADTTLDGGIVVEILVEGEGERASEGDVIVFEYDAYRAPAAEQDSQYTIPWHDGRIQLDDAADNPVDAALQLALLGQHVGTRVRIFIPADPSKPALGDLWITAAIEQVRDYPPAVGLEAFSGPPIDTTVTANGLVIEDYAPGTGPVAVAGELVEWELIAMSQDGELQLMQDRDSEPSTSIYQFETDDDFTKHYLEGARVGLLRKIIAPLGYVADASGPPTSEEVVMYIQVLWIGPQ